MSYMAKVYANLVRKGEKILGDVPEKLRDEVQQLITGEKEND